MSERTLHRLVAAGVFLVAAFVYMRTLSATVVFWDVGEFCAASRLLEVPHPPGSPLFVLVARLASLIPFRDDIAARMHSVSAIGSAFGIMFLYFVGVKLVKHFRSIENSVDRLIVYGSSAIGALALAFSTTYWDNSIEAEVYGLGMFFVSVCLWLALTWWEHADEPRSERYFLMIAYLLGLSTGVHILALLPTIPILMLYYFRKYEFSRKTFLRFSAIALAIFFVIYPGIVQFLPSLLDGEFKEMKSPILQFIPLAVVVAAAYGVYKSIKNRNRMLNVACISFLFIVLGYSTYILVLQRANVPDLPMKENNPSTLAGLTAYITREQYGDVPLLRGASWDNDAQDYAEKWFPRRPSREAMHRPTRVNYSSDWDFFWRYQVSHMYIRYVLWNFAGAEGDWQDARANIYPLNGIGNGIMKSVFNTTPFGGAGKDSAFLLPLLASFFGFIYHFRKDWKMGLVLLVLFIIMGIVLDLYQNQQDPQPRERDYFYVGAYYAMAVWIIVGMVGFIDLIRRRISGVGAQKVAISVMLAFGMVAIPLNLLRLNWFEHDRSRNYTAWDYAYNLLQSSRKDAILFTNGDNDTFPLWYLQDVEGIRRDVRIVNLSLLNTSWYILQLKNEMPHGTEKVPISMNDDQVMQVVRNSPVRWNPREVDLPVPPEVIRSYGVTDSSIISTGKIRFMFSGVPYQRNINMLRVQDIMVREIIMTNNWRRPISFAVTVSPDAKIGLESFLWMRGLVWELKPMKNSVQGGAIERSVMEQNILAANVTPVATPQNGYLYRNLNDPGVYYDENIQRLVMNYRGGFIRLTFDALRMGEKQRAKETMIRLEQTIPIEVTPIRDWVFTARIMGIFDQLGDTTDYEKYSRIVESSCLNLVNNNEKDMNTEDNPYRYLIEIYDRRKDYRSALDVLNRIAEVYPDDAGIKSRIRYYQQLVTGRADADSLHAR